MMLLNPAFLYASTWLFVFALYSLGLSHLLQPLATATTLLVVGSSLAFILGWGIESLPKNGRLALPKFDLEALSLIINSTRVGRRLRMVWIFFGLGVTFEIIYFGGAPGIGLIGIGPEIAYTAFGIPSFHGLLNSMFYAACAVQFSRIILGSSSSVFFLTLISICYPVIGMSRQILISLLLQYMLIYLSIKPPSFKIFFRIGTLFIIVFMIFGFLGDIRSGREQIIYLSSPTFQYPEWLPSAFIWFYIYICTPLNNVNFNIDIEPNYLPLETIGTFIPSFVREAFMDSVGGGTQQWNLGTDSFNANSLLQSLLTDFGVAGTIIFMLLCGIGFTRVLRCSRTIPAAFFALIVLSHGIALSFFANLLFHLAFIFEIFIISWIVARGRRL
jgi:oligosaccharide repeat unit polymerase